MAPSDHNLTKNDSISSEHNLIFSQSAQISNSRPQSKRRKSKPIRFEASRTDMHKENSSPDMNVVVSDPSGSCSSLHCKKFPTKSLKTLVPSSPVMVRAVEAQCSLGSEFPSCIKMMLRSQVSSGFWLGLPLHFCKSFMPKEDVTLVLEDEKGDQCDVKYIAYKYGLSGGWKSFVATHNLMEGDVLLLHLVETTKFKVYIFKVTDSSEVVDVVPVSIFNEEAHSEQITPVTPSPRTKKNKLQESLSLTTVQRSVKKTKKSATPSRSIGNDSEEGCSKVPECSRPTKSSLSFQVKSFEDFHILVNGLSIDHELPDDVRTSYYKLCFYKKEFLHDGLPEGLYYKLVVGMIGEIVNIANEIKNCKLTTSEEDFETWDNSLKSFEFLGMKVGFLRDKIHTLATLLFESEGASDIKRYVEAKSEHKRVKDEANKVAARLVELNESAKKFKGILGDLKRKMEKYEHKLQEENDALW